MVMETSNNRIVLLIGAGAALISGLGIAAVLYGKREPGPVAPPPASQGGLQVSVNDAPALDQAKQLRCFVDGQYVGQFTLEDCARKNGVAAQALDVGLDESGALTAAPTASLAPPPALPAPTKSATPRVEPTPAPTAEPAHEAEPVVERAAGAACLRYAGSDWRQLAEGASLNGCVQALFAGRCVRPGEAVYGRYGDVTLRLVPGRVEQSFDNRTFRTLIEQKRGCVIPDVR